MNSSRILAGAILATLFPAFPALPDRIVFKDGSTLEGQVIGRSGDRSIIRSPHGTDLTVPSATIDRIIPVPGDHPPLAENRPASPPQAVTVRLTGSNTIGERLMPALLQAYLRGQGGGTPRVTSSAPQEIVVDLGGGAAAGPRFEIRSHGTMTGFAALEAAAVQPGEANDVAMASAPIPSDLVRRLAGRLGDITGADGEHVVALDGVAVIVNPLNHAISTLTTAQLADLFSCRVTDWAQLGGRPGPVSVMIRDDNSGTLEVFREKVLRGGPLCSSAQRFGSNPDLAAAVARDPAAIGFVGLAYTGEAKRVAVAECRTAYPPTTFFVKTEEYPLSRRLFLYTADPHSQAVEEMLAFTRSATGQRVVHEAGYVDLAVEENGGELPVRMAAALPAFGSVDQVRRFNALLAGAARLSVTFRFRTNSDRLDLDTRAVRDLTRLAAFMASPAAAGRPVMLVGFSDDVGDYAYNLKLSQRRARDIAFLLRQHGISVVSSDGFGPEAPVACNTGEEGRHRNRRVEVWLGERR